MSYSLTVFFKIENLDFLYLLYVYTLAGRSHKRVVGGPSN